MIVYYNKKKMMQFYSIMPRKYLTYTDVKCLRKSNISLRMIFLRTRSWLGFAFFHNFFSMMRRTMYRIWLIFLPFLFNFIKKKFQYSVRFLFTFFFIINDQCFIWSMQFHFSIKKITFHHYLALNKCFILQQKLLFTIWVMALSLWNFTYWYVIYTE